MLSDSLNVCRSKYGKQYLVYDQCSSFGQIESERRDPCCELENITGTCAFFTRTCEKQILKHGKLKNSCTDFHISLVFMLKLCQKVQDSSFFSDHGNV